MRTASVVRTVAIACRPAARIVSPDSTRSTVEMHSLVGTLRKDRKKVRTDTVGEAECACSFDTSAYILNLRLPSLNLSINLSIDPRSLLRLSNLRIHPSKIIRRKNFEARNNPLPAQSFYIVNSGIDGYLDLEGTFSEAEFEEFGCVGGHLGFEDDVVACYAEVHGAFADEGGDVGGGEEDTAVHNFEGEGGCEDRHRWLQNEM